MAGDWTLPGRAATIRHPCAPSLPTLDTTLPASDPPVREVPLLQPFRWLERGYRDFGRALGPSILHGAVLAFAGLSLIGVAWGKFYLLSGAISGYLLVAPILVTGLYELSRRLERGEPATLREVLAAWRRGTRPLVWLGLALMVVGTFWVLISVVLIALFVQAPIIDFNSFLHHVVLSESSNLFYVWIMFGGTVAALVFAGAVVAAPLLLDREVGLLTAVTTSLRAVSANPVAMALWASMIMVITSFGMITGMIGLIFVAPILGHASWHAYVDVVDSSSLPPRR